MAQATASQCPASSATFNEDVYKTLLQLIEERFAMIGLLGGLYGVLVILSALSAYALTHRRIQPTAIVLCVTLLVLFMSTTTYLVTTILSWRTDFATSLILSAPLLWSYNQTVDLQLPNQNTTSTNSEQFHDCCVMAALITNVILGDAIVCWRACVAWQNNRGIWAICSIFLLATFIPGTINITQSCNSDLSISQDHYNVPIAGAKYAGFPAGPATAVLSLATNVLATSLIACKAWESRRRLRGYFVGGSVASQVEKLFALLIESGAIYCALWAFAVAFGLVNDSSGQTPGTQAERAFARAGVFLEPALVPLIAIYPMVIIVFVALHRSHVEKALTHDQSVPTPHLSLVLGAVADSRHDGGPGTSPPMSGASVTDGSGIAIDLADGLDGANERTGQERLSKIEGII